MKIHSDVITVDAIVESVIHGLRGVNADVQKYGSRSHRFAYNVSLTGNGANATQWQGAQNGDKAATWDEWGVVIGRLYLRDPLAVWGTVKAPIYASAEHFHWVTGARFSPSEDYWGWGSYVLLPHDTHKRHSWEPQGTCVTGAYHVSECKKCSALTRRMAHGRSFKEEIASMA